MPRKLRQHGFVGILFGGGVLIHPQNARRGQQPGQLLLHPLGAEAAVRQLAAAVGAKGGRRLHGMPAVVAHQSLLGLVVDQRHTAMRAFQHMTAGGTHSHRAIAAPVQQQDALFPVVEVFLQLLRQPPADLARVARRQLGAHIDKIHLRQRLAAVAVF